MGAENDVSATEMDVEARSARRIWILSLILTGVLTLGFLAVAWVDRWLPFMALPAITEYLVTNPWFRDSFYGQSLTLSLAILLLIGPGLLVIVRLATRGRDTVWLLLPTAALLGWGLLVGIGYFHPPVSTGPMNVYKPVVYLYPTEPETVHVALELDGRLTECDPPVDPGTTAWTVEASPDGRLVSRLNGKDYPYLFWEGVLSIAVDTNEGFVVARSEVGTFLGGVLAYQGLSETERADFIEYWEPRMAKHPFVFVRFEQDAYERVAGLRVTPEPDTTIRVFMVYRGLERPWPVSPQTLPAPSDRHGFVVVEWGGAELPSR